MSNIINATNLNKNLIKLKDCINKEHIKKSMTLVRCFKIFDGLFHYFRSRTNSSERKNSFRAALQHNAFQKGHLGGHPRIDSLKMQIRRHFWFLKMNEFIEFAVRSCHLCQIFTIKTTKEPITPIEPLSKPGMKSVLISLA